MLRTPALRNIFCAIAIVIFIASSSDGLAFPTVEKIEGLAEMKISGKPDWVKLKPGSLIPDRSRIQTKLRTKLLIKLPDGSTISLNENSLFEVVQASRGKYVFRLWVGAIRALQKPLPANSIYNIITPVAVAGVRGTDFSLGTRESGHTSLSVYEGLVDFRSTLSGQSALVAANQSAVVAADGRLSEVTSGVPELLDDFLAETVPTIAAPPTGVAGDRPLSIVMPGEGDVVSAPAILVAGYASPGTEVNVQGQSVVADASGLFSTNIALVEGANVIAVSAGGENASITVTLDSRRPTIVLGPYPELTKLPFINLTVGTKDGATVSAGGSSIIATGGIATLQLTLTEGENLITITSTDARGLSAQQTIRIVVDTIKPFITISSLTSDAAGIRVSGVTEAGATVTANGYPLELRSDGTFDEVVTGITASDVTFEAVDPAGNVTRDVRNVSGTVDSLPPSLVSLSYSPASLQVGNSVTISLTVSDVSAVASSLAFSLGGPGGTLTATLTASGYTYTGSVNVPATFTGGNYTPGAVVLSDVLGNVTTVSPVTTLTVLNSAPSTPSISSVVDATTGGKLTITWSSVSDPDLQDYTLYRGSSASGPWIPVAIGTATSAVQTSLIDGTSYYYYVTARDIAGNISSPSSVQSGTPSDQAAPSTPVSVNATPTGTTSINVSWSSVAGASNYKIYRSLSPGGGAPWSLLGQTTSNNFNVLGLSPSTTYRFSVTALDNNTAPPTGVPNESTVGSNSASATTL